MTDRDIDITEDIFNDFFDALEIDRCTDGEVPDYFKEPQYSAEQLNTAFETVCDTISDVDLLQQCMEECAELTQACSKMIRAIRGTNPTPVSEEEATKMIQEEASDLLLILELLGYHYIAPNENPKIVRWATRLTGEVI